MQQLLENPLPSLLIGGILTAILAGGWLQTGRKSLVYAMLAVILLTVGAAVLERVVVTDREQITATLHEIADLVERNEIDAALEYAYSGSPEVRQQAANELPLYKFSEVSIKNNLEIEVFPDRTPPTAEATFNVTVIASTRSGSITNYRVPRYVEVTMKQELDGRWRVAAYQHFDPRRGWTIDPDGRVPEPTSL